MINTPKPATFCDPYEWLTNVSLRLYPPEHRGVLIDLMAIASSGNPYGYVVLGPSYEPLSDDNLASFLRIDPLLFRAITGALRRDGHLAVAEHTGALFIPAMVRAGEERAIASDAGKRGGGNPALVAGGAKGTKPAASVTLALYEKILPEHLQTPEVRESLKEWLEYRQRRRIATTVRAASRQVHTLTPLTAVQAVEWIECAIDRGWRGLYPPPPQNKYGGSMSRRNAPAGTGKGEREYGGNDNELKVITAG